MATYINTPGGPTEPAGASTTGWVVAVVILVLVVVAGYFLWPKTNMDETANTNTEAATGMQQTGNGQGDTNTPPTINNTTFNSSTTINTTATTTR